MKRYVRSAISNWSPYEPIKDSEVTYLYLWEQFPDLRDDDRLLRIFVSAICSWKSDAKIRYHHLDMDTSNQDPGNIILTTDSAHGYMHSTSVELTLMHKFGFTNVPGYQQGMRAIQTEQKMYRKLYEILDWKNYTAWQIVDDVKEFLDTHNVKSDPDVKSSLIDFLKHKKFNIVQKKDISYIVSDFKRSFGSEYSGIPDVDMVDHNTALKVIHMLEHMRDEDVENRKNNEESYKHIKKSYDAIIGFIASNSSSLKDIADLRYGSNSFYKGKPEDTAK